MVLFFRPAPDSCDLKDGGAGPSCLCLKGTLGDCQLQWEFWVDNAATVFMAIPSSFSATLFGEHLDPTLGILFTWLVTKYAAS